MNEQRHLAEIQIGIRTRKDMGDLQGLADSIKRHGLLHPVVIKADGTLVAGHRRIEAVRLLGVHVIPVTVIDVADLLSAERDENAQRKDFTPTEAVAIGRLIEVEERPKALNRIHKITCADSTQVPEKGRVRTIVANAVGMGPTTYGEAKAVVVAAEADPDKFGDLPAKMDEQRNVHGTYTEMQKRQGIAPKKKASLSKTGNNVTRIQGQQFRAAIWQQVREALTHLSTLPDAAEVVQICRAQMRDKNLVDTKLPVALQYLQEFSNEWSKGSEIAA